MKQAVIIVVSFGAGIAVTLLFQKYIEMGNKIDTNKIITPSLNSGVQQIPNH